MSNRVLTQHQRDVTFILIENINLLGNVFQASMKSRTPPPLQQFLPAWWLPRCWSRFHTRPSLAHKTTATACWNTGLNGIWLYSVWLYEETFHRRTRESLGQLILITRVFSVGIGEAKLDSQSESSVTTKALPVNWPIAYKFRSPAAFPLSRLALLNDIDIFHEHVAYVDLNEFTDCLLNLNYPNLVYLHIFDASQWKPANCSALAGITRQV